MYYRNRNTQLNANMGGALKKENAERTLKMQDVTQIAETENRPEDTNGASDENEMNSPFSGMRRPPRQGSRQATDFGLMQALYTDVSKKLLPYVKHVVDDNIYEGSPILRDIGPDRASLDKMINEVLDAAQREFDQAEEICLENCREDWNSYQILYNLAESLVLAEVFLNKRLRECGEE